MLSAYERSGLPQKEFARRHGIHVSTLQRWLHCPAADPVPAPGCLIKLPNWLGTPPAGPTYRVGFPRGLTLELPAGCSAGEVRWWVQLFQAL